MLPPTVTDAMKMDVTPQIHVLFFPGAYKPIKIESNGPLSLTPCEALELSQALSIAAQHYLYNQTQYREEITNPPNKDDTGIKSKIKNNTTMIPNRCDICAGTGQTLTGKCICKDGTLISMIEGLRTHISERCPE